MTDKIKDGQEKNASSKPGPSQAVPSVALASKEQRQSQPTDKVNKVEVVHSPSSRLSRSKKQKQPGRAGEQENHGDENEMEMKYGARHVIHLFVPVSLCMAFVIFTMNTVGYYTRKDGQYLIYTPFTRETDSTSERIMMSLGNAFVILFVVILMTLILILLYKFRFYRVINAWLILSSLMLLSLFTFMYLQEVFKSYNKPVDYIMISFVVWNYGFMGMICIHWKGPLHLQQGYLIMMSALMALTFIKYLPEWTVWAVLAVISIWDLIAVLCPKGPLRILVETAQERNEPIFPALIYSSGVVYAYTLLSFGMVDRNTSCAISDPQDACSGISGAQVEDDDDIALVNGLNPSEGSPPSTAELLPSSSGENVCRVTFSHSKIVRRFAPNRIASGRDHGVSNVGLIFDENSSAQRSGRINERRGIAGTSPSSGRQAMESQETDAVHANRNSPQNFQKEEERGIKLGLGDFIFYSVLVGKASSYGDWNTTIACYVAILIGLCLTLMLLAVFRKALPALPISVFSGLIFYFTTRGIITPFCTNLSIRHLVY